MHHVREDLGMIWPGSEEYGNILGAAMEGALRNRELMEEANLKDYLQEKCDPGLSIIERDHCVGGVRTI